MHNHSKLQHDLKILTRFNESIPDYLRATALYYPTGINYPQLTFGGFLMRQHRLLLLRHLLSQADKNQLDKAVADFHAALDNNIVRFENKCHKELQSRLRQWKEYLRDIQIDRSARGFYKTSVEPRLMIDAIVAQLQIPPYQLKSDVPTRLESLDIGLRSRWLSGDFIWDQDWQPAYPESMYWYLYGEVA